jgi:hypothetical protein
MFGPSAFIRSPRLLACVVLESRPTRSNGRWFSAYQNNPSLSAQRAALKVIDENLPHALSGYRAKVSITAAGPPTAPVFPPSNGSRQDLARRYPTMRERNYAAPLKAPASSVSKRMEADPVCG